MDIFLQLQQVYCSTSCFKTYHSEIYQHVVVVAAAAAAAVVVVVAVAAAVVVVAAAAVVVVVVVVVVVSVLQLLFFNKTSNFATSESCKSFCVNVFDCFLFTEYIPSACKLSCCFLMMSGIKCVLLSSLSSVEREAKKICFRT